VIEVFEQVEKEQKAKGNNGNGFNGNRNGIEFFNLGIHKKPGGKYQISNGKQENDPFRQLTLNRGKNENVEAEEFN
jgi:hypothetical protein